MQDKLLVITLPFPGVWNAPEAASQLTRVIRSHDRSLRNDQVVQLPLVDGCTGTIDFLVTHSLGSFLEVEASDARGDDAVVPIGFAGEGGKLAVIEMPRVAAVQKVGEPGTTKGIGELIMDSLDEGAFSILLGHEEPLACDAGLGAASALGVRFYDSDNKELPVGLIGIPLSNISRIDATGKSFALLSSRIYIARCGSVKEHPASDELKQELERLAEIIRRDVGIPAPIVNPSASAIEFGLGALLGAESQNGMDLVLEAAQIKQAIEREEFVNAIILSPSVDGIELNGLGELVHALAKHTKHTAVIVNEALPKSWKPSVGKGYSLQEVQLFQPPLTANSGADEVRRNLAMRMEKLLPIILESFAKRSSGRSKPSQSGHA